MRLTSFRIRPENIEAVTRTVERAGAGWLRFGSDVLIYSANSNWNAVSKSIIAGAEPREGKPREVRKGEMHLVVQKGRVFQNEYPDVPVLFDKGRYLVVEMDRKTAALVERRDEPSFQIEPLRENQTVFDVVLPSTKRRDPDPRVAALVGTLDLGAFEANLAHLVSYPTRFSTSSHFEDAANWAADKLATLGYAVNLDTVTVDSAGQSRNVVATQYGSGAGQREHIIVVAHLDSVNHPGGPESQAPGADDNASGSTGVLEMARVLAGRRFFHDLTFILFGGEEQGLHGSRQFVAGLPQSERDQIRAVVNMDMIGSLNTPQPTVLLEGAPLSQDTIDILADAAARYTNLSVQTSLNPFASDHVPFIESGIPAVLTIEGADGANDAIHTANDTLENVDSAFAVEILKMNVACVAELAIVQDGAQPGCGCGPAKGSIANVDRAEGVRLLASHYQNLFAQYSRLHNVGRLQPQDYAAWQEARRLYETLAGPQRRVPDN